jgi:hypothetical protein
MADSKITALTALTAADPVNDMFPVVDVSDTTMAASGTTKKISVNNILGASGTATLASATITGDLTVDTSTLKVDSTNNRVGIGTASPTAVLTVNGEISVTDNFALRLGSTQAGGATLLYNGSGNLDITPRSGFHTKLVDGNLIIGTSGKGIDFSAVTGGTGTATANVLNDYEEGTWTIAINDQLGNSATIASQIARYVKIGRRVSVYGDFTLSAKGSAGGGSVVYLSSLPFVPLSTCFEGSVVHKYDNTNLTTNGQINIMSAAAGNTLCLFPVSSATTGTSFLTFTEITNTTRFLFNFSYDA